MSDGYWQRAFNRDPGIVGRTIAFADHDYTVIGIMPPTFRYFAGAQADAWLPIGEREGDDVAARLRPGLNLAQAQRALNASASRASGTSSEWLIERPGWKVAQGPAQTMLLSLMGAVGFVLLIACANVANLLLARTLTRQHEIAIRGSLGATRGQLIRQFLLEGIALGALGGLAALALASWAIQVMPLIVPGKLTQSLLSTSLPSRSIITRTRKFIDAHARTLMTWGMYRSSVAAPKPRMRTPPCWAMRRISSAV